MRNEMHIRFSAVSENESFARVAVAAFLTNVNPTLDELTEIKTVVSEAVTNSIIHGYDHDAEKFIELSAVLEEGKLDIVVRDEGHGISDIPEAMEPLYSSKPELERSGMGFTIMENFMDEVSVESGPGQGTVVRLTKYFAAKKALCN
ncbi:anti-sigma F factor [Aureibacillus halotolerans]|uniref:Anti-sigma F factor n=1 Tax=Aureibacillus halotolerans TaxID=1508390 RepID=A0A4R6U9T1_9BACI|nr:anti-sigma F factor [Aureibacillus halotolerans]TDQ41599.1 stage II sporulation protein AB (anti-sigma F factor) [Aureibacillus halotolerans]